MILGKDVSLSTRHREWNSNPEEFRRCPQISNSETTGAAVSSLSGVSHVPFGESEAAQTMVQSAKELLPHLSDLAWRWPFDAYRDAVWNSTEAPVEFHLAALLTSTLVRSSVAEPT